MNNKKFIYITDPFYSTVKDSQVTNWLKLLGENDIVFDLVIITPLKYLLLNNKLRKQKLKYVKQNIKGKIYQIPIINNKDKTGLSEFMKKRGLQLILKRYNNKNIIIQTRIYSIANALKYVKSKLNNCHVIYDNRGAVAEEYINGLGYKNIDSVTDQTVINKYNHLISTSQNFYKIADKVICVSNKLKEYSDKISNNQFSSKFEVVPGAADNSQFYFDIKIRESIREKLMINNNTKVIIYTGRLLGHWHMKEFIFELVSNLYKHIDNILFVCLTPDINKSYQMLEKYKIELSHVIIRYEPYNNINKYLNAADFGLMIRDDIQTNNVASPTKLPEYLLAGLPVIISENVGDYSDFVQKNNLGLVVKNNINLITSKIKETKVLDKNQRLQISQKTEQKYSKQSNLNTLMSIYSKL